MILRPYDHIYIQLRMIRTVIKTKKEQEIMRDVEEVGGSYIAFYINLVTDNTRLAIVKKTCISKLDITRAPSVFLACYM